MDNKMLTGVEREKKIILHIDKDISAINIRIEFEKHNPNDWWKDIDAGRERISIPNMS